MSVQIASFNIACSIRDERDIPLYVRLPLITELIKKEKHNFNILCIQEIRPTGTLTPLDVILEISKCLGGWEFIDQKVNPSAGSFHRTTFFNPLLYSHQKTNVFNIENKRESHFPYMIMKSYFTKLNSLDNKTEFSVMNVHAPMNIVEKQDYWNVVNNNMELNCYTIGDLNKFEEHLDIYNNIFTTFIDKIPQNIITFVGFENDLRKDGTEWRCCLDSIIVHKSINVDFNVISTENKPRESDHFFIIGKIN